MSTTTRPAVHIYDPKYRQLSIKLDKLAPRIELSAGSVHIIQDPAQFYELLKDKIRHAERRIFLSTLYIGKTEHELVSPRKQRIMLQSDQSKGRCPGSDFDGEAGPEALHFD